MNADSPGPAAQHRMCRVCGLRPRVWLRVDFCFTCWPGGPVTPPPCLRCGSTTLYWSAGLCRRCHAFAVSPPDACRNCLAWGASRRRNWTCEPCAAWIRRHRTPAAPCTVCRHRAVLDGEDICRLCRRQAAAHRVPHLRTDWNQVRRQGQQLFIAGLPAYPSHAATRDPSPYPDVSCAPSKPARAVPRLHQPLLFETPRTLRHRGGSEGLARRADPELAAQVDQFTTRQAEQEGWDRELLQRVRTGINIVLGLIDTPGMRLSPTDVDVLKEMMLPAARVTALLKRTGLLEDDRICATTFWAHQHIDRLPAAMAHEMHTWLTVMRDGSTTPPRRRPRSDTTIRLYLSWSLPALTHWADAGKATLREITPRDIAAVLPPTGRDRIRTCRGLRALFQLLARRHLLFTDPTTWLRTGPTPTNTPLPLPTDPIHDALTSPRPATALLSALAAFHGLSSHDMQHLHLAHLDGTHLRINDRSILLAHPVRDRLDTYLRHRTNNWPTTTNPHLFIHRRSATTPLHVSHHWIRRQLSPHISPRTLRTDRLLHEATATGGDTQRLIDLFGLSPTTAQRYTAALGHPALRTRHP
ncbi:hypothetical protein ACFWA4_32175 [Streptomyces sp. NPDC060011]|uniref:hypothetical protein n=1 Tax=Streptomyces sp. NPDC060011 TaxID=3347037 RepID=UPI00367C1E58